MVQNIPSMNKTAYVWKIFEGPYELEDDGYSELDDYQGYLRAMVTYGESEEWEEREIFFSSFNDAYEFKRQVDTSMEPIEIG